jgi:hypothetical protein
MSAESERARRDLRLRIGRLRRRIDGRVRAADREARRLGSWRTYVTYYPGGALLVAFGAGLALSAALSPRGLTRWLAWRLVRQGWGHVCQAVTGELRRIWAESAPATPASEPGSPDHA